MRKAPYYVSFFKRIYDCTGHSHECCQGEVEVLASNNAEAVAIARRRFAELKNIADWSMFADYEKVWDMTGNEKPQPPVPASGRPARRPGALGADLTWI